MAKNKAASIYDKLKSVARNSGVDMQSLVRLYVQQRLLYRISVTPAASKYSLKGGLMLSAYYGDFFRSSNDLDLDGQLDGTLDDIRQLVSDALAAEVEDDGVEFDGSDIRVLKEMEDKPIAGGKVVIEARLHTAKVQVRIDVGFNNAVRPQAEMMEIPTLLPGDVPMPVIAGYPLSSIISEKLHAVAQHGWDNTRMKDYYDIWQIINSHPINGDDLTSAINATFERFGRVPTTSLPGLSHEFAVENERNWRAFAKKSKVAETPPFTAVMDEIRRFIQPAIEAACSGQQLSLWVPVRGWPEGDNPYNLPF